MGHYDLSRLHPGPSKYDDGPRRREGGVLEKYPPLRAPPGLPEPSTFLADLEKSTQSFLSQQRASLSLSSQYELEGTVKSNAALKNLQGHPGHSRHGQGLGMVTGPGMGQLTSLSTGPETKLIYDEFLHQHRRPVSKLDLEEKRRREAREKGTIRHAFSHARKIIDHILFIRQPSPLEDLKSGVSGVTSVFFAGYYYELDDSYDESDEEEVRAHLRRVAEQPPLKLDDSTEVNISQHILLLPVFLCD